MAAAAAAHGEHKLQPTSSCRSAGSAGTFISCCPAGALDPPGLAPVANCKVYVRPVSGKRVKKPSALDKHLRHVVLQQRANRQKAQQHAATVQHKHIQHQRFLDWGHRLRHAILHRGASSSRQHRQEQPGQPVTAPAAPAAGHPQQQQQQHADDADHACADTLQSWKPVAAAAQVRELQESTRQQDTLLRSSLPCVLDPSTLSTDNQTQQQMLQEQGCQHNNRAAARAPAGLSSPSKQNSQCVGGSGTAAAEGRLPGDSDSLLDVDAFLDDLLQTASAAPATAAPAHPGASGASPLDPPASSTLLQQQQPAERDNANSSQQSSQAAALHQQRPVSSCSSRKGSVRRGGSVPAWVLSEAAAAEAEEETLLEFAQGLDFQELLWDLPDDELSAAFHALELADAGAAEGQQDADGRWRQTFVSALNAAAMRGIVDHNAAAAATPAGSGEAGSQQGDRRSFVSSASALRRAEAAATRREQLLQKLHRLTGTQPPAAAAAGPGMLLEGGAKAGGSLCGSTCSRLGTAAAAGAAAGGSAAACHGWDSSTLVSSTAEDVGVLRSAIKHLEAGEVLAENPEMRGVHSTASVRSMLSRLDAQT